MSSGGFGTTHYQNTENYMKSTELEQQTNPPLLIASVRQSALFFRAWNRELKEMFWFDLMWGSLHNKGTGWIGMLPIEQKERKEIKSFTQSDDRFAINPTNCEIMRFTGLKDAKGIEIYEGDIIQYPKHEGYLMDSFKAEIRFIESYACFGYLKLGLNEYGFDHVIIHPFSEHDEFEIDVLPYFEVIGNIYENPELINGAF
jgi:uncharacterized phage protein (TIGR01671 family)